MGNRWNMESELGTKLPKAASVPMGGFRIGLHTGQGGTGGDRYR